MFYNVSNYKIIDPKMQREQIPSINIARYPNELLALAKTMQRQGVSFELQQNSMKVKRNPWQKLGGYFKFIIAWDKSFMTRRAVS